LHRTMALRLTGSLWQQVVGSGIIPYSAIALPTADSAKKSQLRQNPTNSQHRGSIWHRCGSLWRFSDSMYCKTVFQLSLLKTFLLLSCPLRLSP
ncbi:hypothetical protein PQG93_14050, partial [Bacteroidaceae bacterium UO.H1004]|nr:hypothetical protein [Bacteroidaceae bacterium UO.H1004]